jgi:hypothetical protein
MIDFFRTLISEGRATEVTERGRLTNSFTDRRGGMNLLRLTVFSGLVCVLGALAFAQTPQVASDAGSQGVGAARDGQHDFDFNIGVWHTHIRRVLDPLSGGTHTMELNGTVTVRKVWDGHAQLEEIEADGPKGHWEGLTMFLYNPASHQWSQSYIGSKEATLEPPLIGSFKDGRGELFAQDTDQNKAVLVRGVWSEIAPDSHHFQEDLSNDGGKTWAPTFICGFDARERRRECEVGEDLCDGECRCRERRWAA